MDQQEQDGSLEMRTSAVEEGMKSFEVRMNGICFDFKILLAQFNIMNEWISSKFDIEELANISDRLSRQRQLEFSESSMNADTTTTLAAGNEQDEVAAAVAADAEDLDMEAVVIVGELDEEAAAFEALDEEIAIFENLDEQAGVFEDLHEEASDFEDLDEEAEALIVEEFDKEGPVPEDLDEAQDSSSKSTEAVEESEMAVVASTSSSNVGTTRLINVASKIKQTHYYSTSNITTTTSSKQKTKRKWLMCHFCDRLIPLQNSRRHMRSHTGEKPFICGFCHREFRVAVNLELHTRSAHTGEKPYKCNTCSEEFVSAGLLKVHHHNHNTGGEKNPFQCNICSRIFTRRAGLNQHLNWHRGVKPYECHLCHSKYTTSSNRVRHLKEVHRIGNYGPCHICGLTFNTHRKLKRHVGEHTMADTGRNGNELQDTAHTATAEPNSPNPNMEND